MAFNITITNPGNTLDKAISTLRDIPTKINQELVNIAEDTKKVMIAIIQASKTREGSSNNLENNIGVEATGFGKTVSFVGIGNIKQLNESAPYWALLNFGGMVAPGARFVPGFFGAGNPPDPALAGTGVGTEKFTYAPGVGSFMSVKNPIAPVNYIEKASISMINMLNVRLNRAIRL